MQVTDIKKIGIIGAGVMGPGIAEVFSIFGAENNFTIVLYDIVEDALEKATLKLDEDFKKVGSTGLFDEEQLKRVRKNIQLTNDIKEILDAELIVEAVPENIELKKKIFSQLEEKISPSTIITTNSSGLSITEIASVLKKPGRCLGTHFMNPPILMPLVEVIKGEKTSEETTNLVMELLKSVNKKPVLVKKDLPGYVHNRLQAALFREIMYLLDQEVISADDLEMTVRYGLGLRLPIMKVFEMVDMMGLDTIKNVLTYLYPTLDKSEKPPAFLQQMIEEGRLGVKSKRGFHDYSNVNLQELLNEKQKAVFQILMMMQQFD
ncbi:MAG: 3-hydroxyacyl-CoA dehydrogenase family protein [Candidatus Hodarchaeales archaeon]